MSGVLVQLSSNHGLQDQILYDKPEFSFFSSSFRRVTNFSVEPLVIPTTIKSLGESATVTIIRSGDLLGETYLMSKFPQQSGMNRGAGNALVSEVSLEIGGQVIDRQSGEYMHMFRELHSKYSKEQDAMCAYSDAFVGAQTGTNTVTPTLFTPLRFFFCLAPSMYLPLVSLQFHDVRLSIRTDARATSVVAGGTLEKNMDLLCNMVYLDESERRRMARTQHQMLIPTVQEVSVSVADGDNKVIDLPFNHPTKSLIWRRYGSDDPFAAPTTAVNVGAEPLESAQLRLNHHNRFGRSDLPGAYFSQVVPFEKFNRVPTETGTYAYSFALDASSFTQPTGTLNCSRVDSIVLDLKYAATPGGTIKVFAESWNLLRIFSGMGGLAYSN